MSLAVHRFRPRRTWRHAISWLGVAVAGVAGVGITAPVALADTVVGTCTIRVPNPWPLEPLTSCPGADLRGADLHGVNFVGANLKGADLSGGNLEGANIHLADLSGAKLNNVNLKDSYGLTVVLHSADLSGTDITRGYWLAADLSNTKLVGANLTDTDLAGANLAAADLTGANLSGANLTSTLLVPSVIYTDADQSGTAAVTWPAPANLPGTVFEGCDRTSGDRFPVGQTLVNCTVNSAGGRGTGTFSVHVNPPPTETPNPPIVEPGEGSSLFGS
ncbi:MULTISPECIES: pentapeptide repeat-containing protein [unclassified Rhodococcus (in: high G+C Gram-positive bacteria)]|uniref:pentapeptide repeat-containing protein n=1 Tax=unclassified Rhodococcus (in: high G+C Gram-positive bacteria) TaxID=192944 RepID=UPI00211C3513|nr:MULTISPECIES: pentapeptide repeat-containing protein [unclassified Rhodococcus (in: high G+C Gram-positive bacteria)]MDI9977316.1 pentapeptide repeat-containing protein [Rhodococcus sp. IEGM 1307]